MDNNIQFSSADEDEGEKISSTVSNIIENLIKSDPEDDDQIYDKHGPKMSHLPYTLSEEKNIVKYFMENGGFQISGGNKIWKKIEQESICPGRSWQSLRDRFNKKIVKRLPSFGVTKKELMAVKSKFQSCKYPVEARKKRYTVEEDMKMLRFLLEKNRIKYVRGNSVWELMERRGIVQNRSWLSMKNRFTRHVIKILPCVGIDREMIQKYL